MRVILKRLTEVPSRVFRRLAGRDDEPSSEVVLIVYHHLRLGGVERKIADIAGELDRHPLARNREFYLVLDEVPPADPGERHFYDAVHSSASVAPLYRPQGHFRGFPFPFSLFIVWQAFRLRPRTVIAFLRRSGIYAILLKFVFPWRRMKVFVSDDTTPSRSLALDMHDLPRKHRFSKLAYRSFYPRADGIVVPSEQARRDLIENFSVPERLVFVNRNWTALTTSPSSPRGREDYDLVFVGRMDPEKNVRMLVDLVAETSRHRDPVRACVVGTGTLADDVAAYAVRRGVAAQIDFVGSQRRVDEYLRRGKIFCLMSTFEGLPIAALEAMAVGLPVVTTAYPGSEELVVDGETGYVCRTRQEYVERLLELLSDPISRRALGNRGRIRVQERHGRRSLESFLRMFVESVAAEPSIEASPGTGATAPDGPDRQWRRPPRKRA